MPSPPDQVAVQAPLFDFSKTPLAKDYNGCYVKVLDNVFTPEDCQRLIALAESEAKWEQAAVHYGLNAHDKYVDTDYRNSERILRFDHQAAEFLYQRLLPYIKELEEIGPGSQWSGVVASKHNSNGVWKMIGINERLSFLRYGPGNYFRRHCDGRLELPDGRKARVTVQIYLNGGDADELQGGATRIMSADQTRWYDVEPRTGRVLIFQQKGIWHSGEEVTKGMKYAVRSDFMFIQGPCEDRKDETKRRGDGTVPQDVRQSMLGSITSAFGWSK